MPKRTAKQILYGLLYLAFWAAVVSLIYFAWLRSPASCFDNRQNQDETGIDCGGSCIPCELKNIQPLVSDQVAFLPVGDRTTLIARVKNPNVHYGASEFDYAFRVYAPQGALLDTISGKSFVYGNQFNYLVNPALPLDPAKVGRVELVIQNPEWRSEAEFAAPNVQVREQKIAAAGQEVSVSGVAVNNGTLKVSTLFMQALFRNRFGIIIGASQTEVHDVVPFENRRFEIHHPLLPDMDPSQTSVLPPKAIF